MRNSKAFRIVRFEIAANRWRFEALQTANRDSRHLRLSISRVIALACFPLCFQVSHLPNIGGIEAGKWPNIPILIAWHRPHFPPPARKWEENGQNIDFGLAGEMGENCPENGQFGQKMGPKWQFPPVFRHFSPVFPVRPILFPFSGRRLEMGSVPSNQDCKPNTKNTSGCQFRIRRNLPLPLWLLSLPNLSLRPLLHILKVGHARSPSRCEDVPAWLTLLCM